ncbi:cbb3-type cytochrome oxidase assembly protein CcoS [Aquamicrobium zhengzhouense]|uniref:Cbb3-type cytochrome oxidase assembly protein CcoS n=1 Tax=Aquamicrobium zhengzhouense TaxID=2781738 RepID=A0ABS0SI99_9HYPH|nr:cbb3-type cytochrome oxidase assembly protein CcoS [Aquamicrobium zhengzhouense]MBI1622223.1 cbb3-type cytochrome oxidase assembly protein CcoS [Aquamicrobium zhengzhouense]
MSMLVYLIPVALFLGGAALVAFLWALRSGQYEDLDGAAARVLLDDPNDKPKQN